MSVNSFWLMLGAIGTYAIFYRYYSAFVARKVVALDDARITPAHRLNDGQNYHPTNKYVLWGHHFAAIAGAGPLIGPVLAAQYGYMPGFLWLVFGVCLGGAVQDFVILAASMRRNGRSLAEIAREEISPLSGAVGMLAVVFVLIISLAVLGFVVVGSLSSSPWGAFTLLMSVPIALFMGLYMYRLRPGRVTEASVIGVTLLVLCVILGGLFQPGHAWAAYAHWFSAAPWVITACLAVYGFIASVMPVWLLLCPRDYLSAYMKVGTVVGIVAAVLLIHPSLQQPAFSQFIHGGGPIVKGPLFPFVFITIACGAISGFHALVASGTTPKMVGAESQCRAIGYGAMLMESLVGVTALIAASSLPPAQYFAINLKPEAFATLAAHVPMDAGGLSDLAHLVGEATLAGRVGGGVSLAAGIAHIFGQFSGFAVLMKYVYHFVIMFEALFILTTIDTGTRIARFVVQECMGRVYKPLGRTNWLPGTLAASLLVVVGWSYFIFTGSIQTLWPMFGIANQLLAVLALTVGTTVIINEGRGKYAWVTIGPLVFVGVTTLTAGYLSVRDIFIPQYLHPQKAGDAGQGLLLAGLTVVMMACVLIIALDAVPRWLRHYREGRVETTLALQANFEPAV